MNDPFNTAALTTDTFFNGRIRINQQRCGYRFSIDAVILAHHVYPRPDDAVLDLGTGCGVIPLILAFRNPQIRLFGVEVQPGLAKIALANIDTNRFQDRISIHCLDLKTLGYDVISKPVDVVVSNPPYRKAEAGRINPNTQRAVARHEIRITLADVIDCARRMLRTGGKFITIYTAERLTDILYRMRSAGIEPKFYRMIHSGWNTAAKLVLLEGVKGGRPGSKIAPPLIVYNEAGSYTPEIEQMFQP